MGAVAGTSGPIPAWIVLAAAKILEAAAEEVLAIAELAAQSAQLVAYNVFKNTQIGVTYQSGAGDYAEWLPKANVADKFYPGDIIGVKGGLISSSAWSSSDRDRFNHVNVAVGLNANDVATLVMDQMTEISQLERQLNNTNRILADLVPGYQETLASLQSTPTKAESEIQDPSSHDALISASGDVPTYPELTREDLIRAVQEVEEQMRRNGDNVDDHPFFRRLRTDPVYEEQVMAGLVTGFNEATKRRATER